MAISYPGHGVGLRNVGSYQISGHPYLTGTTNMGATPTEHTVSFPHVAKSVTVFTTGSDEVRVHFTPAGAGEVIDGHHFITLNEDHRNITFDVKCKEVYLTNVTANAGFELFASLTGIDPNSMYTLTGSGLTQAP